MKRYRILFFEPDSKIPCIKIDCNESNLAKFLQNNIDPEREIKIIELVEGL